MIQGRAVCVSSVELAWATSERKSGGRREERRQWFVRTSVHGRLSLAPALASVFEARRNPLGEQRERERERMYASKKGVSDERLLSISRRLVCSATKGMRVQLIAMERHSLYSHRLC